jgi:hypothetical protein
MRLGIPWLAEVHMPADLFQGWGFALFGIRFWRWDAFSWELSFAELAILRHDYGEWDFVRTHIDFRIYTARRALS